MSVLTTSAGAGGYLPDESGQLVIREALTASVFATVARVQRTRATEYRVPIVATDPVAQWVAEGAEITPDDPDLAELVVTPKKVAGLTPVSREMADDSDPAVAAVIGEAISRDLARRVDEAMFAGLPAPAPAGLATLAGVQTVVDANAFDDLDFAAHAISLAETVTATVTAFVMNPTTALTLATIKQAAGSNQPVLGMDATSATARRILGVPLYVSEHVAADTVWALDSARTWLVVREPATVEVDSSVYFTSDRLAVRAIMRCAPAFTHPGSIVKVSTA